MACPFCFKLWAFKLLAVEFLIPFCEATETFAERRGRPEIEIMFQFRDICECGDDIAWLHGNEFLMGFEIVIRWQDVRGDEFLLQNRHEI